MERIKDWFIKTIDGKRVLFLMDFPVGSDGFEKSRYWEKDSTPLYNDRENPLNLRDDGGAIDSSHLDTLNELSKKGLLTNEILKALRG